MRNRDTKHSIFKEYDFIRLYCAICVKKGINLVLNHHDLEKQLYKYYSMDDFKDLFEDIVIKEDVAFPENNCVILSEGFQTALTFGILVNINDAGKMRSIITILKENSENIISKYDEQYVSKMSSLVENICTQSKGEIRSNGLAVLTPAPKEGYLPSEQEMEILRSRKKSRNNSENTISDVNIFLTKEDHEQIAEDVIYSILRNKEEKTESEKGHQFVKKSNKK